MSVSGRFFFFFNTLIEISGSLEKTFLLSQGGWESRGERAGRVKELLQTPRHGMLGVRWGKGSHNAVCRPSLYSSVFNSMSHSCPSSPAWGPCARRPTESNFLPLHAARKFRVISFLAVEGLECGQVLCTQRSVNPPRLGSIPHFWPSVVICAFKH